MFSSSHFKLTISFFLLFIVVVVLTLLGSTRFITKAVGVSPQSHTTVKITSSTSVVTCGTWNIVPSQNVSSMSSVLTGVVALSRNNVWGVGYSYIIGGGQTLIEHWNGKKWSIVPSPNPGQGALYAITQVPGTNQLWATEGYGNNGVGDTLIEHWDGTSWSVVPSPNVGLTNNELYGIVSLSPSDAWAVGSAYTANASTNVSNTLIEHWNGINWSIISTPNPSATSNNLYGVTATSSSDVWAVGSYFDLSSPPAYTLIEHWNGSAWSVISNPSPNLTYPRLIGVKAISANNVWAVGTSPRIVVKHWNGKRWNIVPTPNTVSDGGLEGIATVSSNNIWAVGSQSLNSSSQTLIEHWNGSAWKIIAGPNPSASSGGLDSITQVPGTNQLWAVGNYYDSNTRMTYTFTEFYC